MQTKGSVAFGIALAATIALAPPIVAAGDQEHETSGMPHGSVQGKGGGDLGYGLEVEEANGISFVSGGIGDDQQNALKTATGFNLNLTLARQDGKYMGPSALRIENQQGDLLLETQTKGPLFLAKMPAGRYKIHATADGKSYVRDVNVPGTGQEKLVFTWPASASSAGDAPEPRGDLPTGDLPAKDMPKRDLPTGDLPTEDMPRGNLPNEGY